MAIDPTTREASAFDRIEAHVRERVPTAAPTDEAGAVVAGLAGTSFDTVAAVAVCDERRLVGLVPTETLLAAPPDVVLSAIMDPAPPVVSAGVDREQAVLTAVRRGETTVAVVDSSGDLVGLVPPQELITVLLAEHLEDVARASGYLHDASEARSAATESVRRRLWHRLPWLIVGLAGALAAAALLSSAEQRLARVPLVTFFVPGIVYLADAVGTQTEALVIRAMAVGVPTRAMVAREMATGVMAGALLAALGAPIVLVGWGDAAVAATVGVSLLAACSVATTVAVVLPAGLARAGVDPAFGSGPLATVIQDLLSLAIYLSAAAFIVG